MNSVLDYRGISSVHCTSRDGIMWICGALTG